MQAGTSSSSHTLLRTASGEGIKHLYRTLLHQARLLSSTFDDAIIFSSHRFLARSNLEPLSSSSPTTATRRLARAQLHRRQLADANHGWEHAVHRAISLAYGRRGKLRRDALSTLSPQSSASAEESKYPKHLRKRELSAVLSALLLSSASIKGSEAKKPQHLVRPPPPYLPPEDDPLVQLYGRTQGRRREINARNKFLAAYMKKVKLPLDAILTGQAPRDSLFAHLERKAKPPINSNSEVKEEKAFLTSAKERVGEYRSKMEPSAHRHEALRYHGWASSPKDYSAPRRRRRMYARILEDTPLLLLEDATASGEGVRVKNDPLGIRRRLIEMDAIAKGDGKKGKIRVIKSKYGLSRYKNGKQGSLGEGVPKGLFAEEEGEEKGERIWLDALEMDFLRSKGIV